VKWWRQCAVCRYVEGSAQWEAMYRAAESRNFGPINNYICRTIFYCLRFGRKIILKRVSPGGGFLSSTLN
jgi:hypothetical protein